MAYIGEVGKRISAEVTMNGVYEFTTHFGYTSTTNYIYSMADAEGNVLVWKSTHYMSVLIDETKCEWHVIRKGDKIKITGTVKEHSEYRETAQTVLTRCKYELIEKASTKEEIESAKKEEQMNSLCEGDFVWEMPYKQYKEHYADCETVCGSFRESGRNNRTATIAVIIRAGRLKASGVRGEHFKGFQMTNEEGQWITYRAVSEENALKRVQKDFPEHKWECTKIYDYRKAQHYFY